MTISRKNNDKLDASNQIIHLSVLSQAEYLSQGPLQGQNTIATQTCT